MLCSQWQLVKSDQVSEDVLILPCNMWSCEHCQPKRRWQLKLLAAAGEPNKLLTLTVSQSVGTDPIDRRRLIADAWKKLHKRILRFMKWKSLPYMWFCERTKRGEPHLHILLRCEYIPQQWLSSQMRELLNSPIVDIRQIKGQQGAISYVTKYVTKEPAQFGRAKRYFASHDWRVNAGEPVEHCQIDRSAVVVIRRPWRDEIQQRVLQGWTWETLPDGWQRFHRPGSMPWSEIKARAGPPSGPGVEVPPPLRDGGSP
jgi:hypothetical protein